MGEKGLPLSYPTSPKLPLLIPPPRPDLSLRRHGERVVVPRRYRHYAFRQRIHSGRLIGVEHRGIKSKRTIACVPEAPDGEAPEKTTPWPSSLQKQEHPLRNWGKLFIIALLAPLKFH